LSPSAERSRTYGAVTQLTHVAKIAQRDAVLDGADQLCKIGPIVFLRRQLVEECKADICAREQVLLLRGRSRKAAHGQGVREFGARHERVCSSAHPVPEDSFEMKRARVAPQRKLCGPAGARQQRGRQPAELFDIDRRSVRPVSF
jgi:hypothetical protein